MMIKAKYRFVVMSQKGRRKRLSPRAMAQYYVKMKVDPSHCYKKYIDASKGWGVFAGKNFEKNDFILEYRGQLRSKTDMDLLQKQNSIKDTYLYDFLFNGPKCLDASVDDGTLGRLVNDSKESPNAKMKVFEIKKEPPHLCLWATKPIKENEEISYFYGKYDQPWYQSPDDTDGQTQDITHDGRTQDESHDDTDRTGKTEYVQAKVSETESPDLKPLETRHSSDNQDATHDGQSQDNTHHGRPQNKIHDETDCAALVKLRMSKQRLLKQNPSPEPKGAAKQRHPTSTGFQAYYYISDISSHENPPETRHSSDNQDATHYGQTQDATHDGQTQDNTHDGRPQNKSHDKTDSTGKTHNVQAKVAETKSPDLISEPKEETAKQHHPTSTEFQADISSDKKPLETRHSSDNQDATHGQTQDATHDGRPQNKIHDNTDSAALVKLRMSKQKLLKQNPFPEPKEAAKQRHPTSIGFQADISSDEKPPETRHSSDNQDTTHDGQTQDATHDGQTQDNTHDGRPQNKSHDNTDSTGETHYVQAKVAETKSPDLISEPKEDTAKQHHPISTEFQADVSSDQKSLETRSSSDNQDATHDGQTQDRNHDDTDSTGETHYVQVKVAEIESPDLISEPNKETAKQYHPISTEFQANVSSYQKPLETRNSSDNQDSHQSSSYDIDFVTQRSILNDSGLLADVDLTIIDTDDDDISDEINELLSGVSDIFDIGQISMEIENGLNCVENGKTKIDKDGETTIDKDGETTIDKDGETTIDKDGETTIDKDGKTTIDKDGETTIDKDGETTIEKDGETTIDKDGETTIDKDGETTNDKDGETTNDKDEETTIEKDGETTNDKDGETTNDKDGETAIDKDGETEVGTGEEEPPHNTKKSKKKPSRPCPFCDPSKEIHFNSALSRHIRTKHKNLPLVKLALSKPKKEKDAMFQDFKRRGIEMYNAKEISKNSPSLVFERKQGEGDVDITKYTKCSNCKIFVKKTYWPRHKGSCSDSVPPMAVPISAEPAIVCSDLFKQNILNKFRSDQIGNLCRNDEPILQFGINAFDKIKRRIDKQVEVRNSVRNEMRRLAGLYIEFKNQDVVLSKYDNSADMIRRENFHVLKKAIETFTVKGDDLKAGKKASLFYNIKNLAKTLKVNLLIAVKDEEARAVDDFLSILESSKDNVFGEATQKIHKNRQIKLRKPVEMPLEEDIKMLRDHFLERIESFTNDYQLLDSSGYIELRDNVCARLTLFNARRGGEPARMLLENLEEANSGAWLDPRRVNSIEDPFDISLFNSLKITYQMGKGNFKLVPVLIPKDLDKALDKLKNPEIRKDVGVLPSNCYVFPATQGSDAHVGGWQSIKTICKKLELQNEKTITATKQRHRMSTIFASLDLPEMERERFFDHMGHSEEINRNVYQAPPAMAEILTVGKHLRNIDGGANGVPVVNVANSAPGPSSKRKETGRKRRKTKAINMKKKKVNVEYIGAKVKLRKNAKTNYFESGEDSEGLDEDSFDEYAPSDTNESSDEEELGPPHKKKIIAAGRKNFRWTTVQEQALSKEFGPFLKATCGKSKPDEASMKKFVDKYGNGIMTIRKLEVKINNERSKSLKQIAALKKSMNML
uniref:SET domain-containing protein n=2 Tax=Clytia hemisphaerica TaxID=252671 RepID=A0A7M5X9K8_9CNID